MTLTTDLPAGTRLVPICQWAREQGISQAEGYFRAKAEEIETIRLGPKALMVVEKPAMK
jgi:hypothetical protein